MENKVITVDHTEKNDYGDLQVFDSEGVKHKIGNKRSTLFDLFQPGAKIELIYKSFKDKDYIADAKPVAAKALEPKSINHQVNNAADKIEASIEAQVAYKGIMEAFTGGKLNEDHPSVIKALKWADSKLQPIAIIESVEEVFKES